MKTIIISFCEQTHASCRGYACDDHIHMDCHTTMPDPEQLITIRDLLKQAERVANRRLNVAVQSWFHKNPDAIECCYEGAEFVGLKWVDSSEHDFSDTCVYATPAEEIIEMLRGIL